MPITTHIDKSEDITTFIVTGVLSYDEVMTVVEGFYTGEPTKYVLWNLIEATENQLSPEQINNVISFQPRFKRKRESGKTAIIAQDGLLWGLSRRLAIESNKLEARYTVLVFNSEHAAYRWLDER